MEESSDQSESDEESEDDEPKSFVPLKRSDFLAEIPEEGSFWYWQITAVRGGITGDQGGKMIKEPVTKKKKPEVHVLSDSDDDEGYSAGSETEPSPRTRGADKERGSAKERTSARRIARKNYALSSSSSVGASEGASEKSVSGSPSPEVEEDEYLNTGDASVRGSEKDVEEDAPEGEDAPEEKYHEFPSSESMDHDLAEGRIETQTNGHIPDHVAASIGEEDEDVGDFFSRSLVLQGLVGEGGEGGDSGGGVYISPGKTGMSKRAPLSLATQFRGYSFAGLEEDEDGVFA